MQKVFLSSIWASLFPVMVGLPQGRPPWFGFSSFILKKKKTKTQPVILRVRKAWRRGNLSVKMKWFLVLTALVRLLGHLGTSALHGHTRLRAWELTTSTLAVSRAGGFLEHWEVKIPQGLDRHSVKGPERITVRNGPALYFILTAECLGSLVTDLQGLVGKACGGKCITSSSTGMNRWGGFPTCRSGKSAKPLPSLWVQLCFFLSQSGKLRSH